MKAKALEIRWHDTKPIFSVDIQSNAPDEYKSENGCWRVATAGGDKLVRMWLLHPRPTKPTKVAPKMNTLIPRKKAKAVSADDDEIQIVESLPVEKSEKKPEDPKNSRADDSAEAKSIENPKVEYLATLKQHTGVVNVVRFSPVSSTLASAGDDGNVIFWVPGESTLAFGETAEDRMYERESWRVKSMVRSKTGQEIYDIAWSPTGEYLVAGSVDHMANVYDVETGQLLHSIAEHSNYVQGVAWDPLNEYVATESSDRTMHVYGLSHPFKLTNVNRSSKIHLSTLRSESRSRSMSREGASHRRNSSVSSVTSAKDLKEFRGLKPGVASGSGNSGGPSVGGPSSSMASGLTPALTTPLHSDAVSDSDVSEISSIASAMDPPPLGTRRRVPPSPRALRSPSPVPPPPAMMLSPRSMRAPDKELTSHRLFSDANSTPFFRRLAWSPDGSLLLAPAGQSLSPGTPAAGYKPTVFVYARGSIGRPPIAHLPGHRTTSVAVRFSPMPLTLRADGVLAPPVFDLPYRMVYAVLTLDAIYIYDTQHTSPVYVLGNLHYAPFTDLAWSSDGLTLVVSSQDGYCSVIAFEPGELGTEYTGPFREVDSTPAGPVRDAPGVPLLTAVGQSAIEPLQMPPPQSSQSSQSSQLTQSTLPAQTAQPPVTNKLVARKKARPAATAATSAPTVITMLTSVAGTASAADKLGQSPLERLKVAGLATQQTTEEVLKKPEETTAEQPSEIRLEGSIVDRDQAGSSTPLAAQESDSESGAPPKKKTKVEDTFTKPL